MPVLDASFLIDAQGGFEPAVRAVAWLKGRQVFVPFQAALEFVSGFEDPNAPLRMIEENYDLIMPDSDQLLAAAEMHRAAAMKGRRPAWSDVQVAAVAKVRGDILLSADATAMAALGIRAWDYRKSAEPPALPES